MELERKRRIYIQELENKVNFLENFKIRQEENLKNLFKSNILNSLKLEKEKEIKNLIKEKDNELESLKKEINQTNIGENDEKINSFYKKNETKKEIKSNVIEKKLSKQSQNIIYKKKVNNFKAFDRSDNENIPEYVLKNSYKYYNKILDTFPDYLQKKLDYMPNNKGYIFRDCWFFGKQPEDNGPLTMFEKKKDVLRIHEYTQKEYRLFEKIGNDYKRLVFVQPRKIKKLSKY